MRTHFLFTIFCIAFFGSASFAQTIPNFTLENVTLANYKSSKAIVVIFTSSHCSFAKEYINRLNSLNTQYGSQGIQFLAINSNDATLAADDKADKMRLISAYNFPYLKDEDQNVAKLFGATRTPEAYILKPAGAQFEVVYHGSIDDNPFEGAVQKQFLGDAIKSVLEGKKPVNSNANGGSCGMKRKM